MYLDDRRPTITPQLARRVAVLAGIALFLFAVVFFRLWYLQILSGDRYLAEANDNQVREIKVQAPRGQIVDRDGEVLVDNRVGYAVKITPNELPRRAQPRTRLYNELGRVLDMSRRDIRTRVRDQLRAQPFSTATVKQDVDRRVIYYIKENQRRLPGVTVDKVFLREYPRKTVGAHLFGTVGEVTAEQLGKRRYRGVAPGDRIGQSGIESTYDRFLRGENGATRIQVDALGRFSENLGSREPRAGRQLRLSVDLDVQRAGQRALATQRGAFVAMDVRTGAVRALGSAPSFDPNLFSRAIKQSDYDALNSKALGQPLANRAIQGLYPTGSTFKLVTAVAGLEGGLITPDEVIYDPGYLQVGLQRFRNARDVVNGPIALRRALSVSSDVYFYRLGQEANGAGDGQLVQRWAARLGLGDETGIDLPAEGVGLVPDRRWRDRANRQGWGDGRPWSVGDNINLSVGQGDLQANPLQMAVAYAAVANGGRVVRPQLAQRIEDSRGAALQEIDRPARRRVRIAPGNRQAILDGLRMAASAEGGTSAAVFKTFPIDVAGKTGTAERPGGTSTDDQSWYVALAPYPNPRYVVAVTIENGGFGAETAAPAARRILAALFGVRGDEKRMTQATSTVAD